MVLRLHGQNELDKVRRHYWQLHMQVRSIIVLAWTRSNISPRCSLIGLSLVHRHLLDIGRLSLRRCFASWRWVSLTVHKWTNYQYGTSSNSAVRSQTISLPFYVFIRFSRFTSFCILSALFGGFSPQMSLPSSFNPFFICLEPLCSPRFR